MKTASASPHPTDVSNALGGRAYYMGRVELEFPTSSALKSFGLRPSAFVDVGSVWGLRSPALPDISGVLFAAERVDRHRGYARSGPVQGRLRHGLHVHFRLPRALRRQLAEAAPRDWCWRQLGFAFRAAQDRPRKGDPQAGRRRHETLQLQRRNTILMRNIAMTAAFAAMVLAPAAASAQAIPGAVVAVVDLEKVSSDCTACKTAQDGARRPGHGPEVARSGSCCSAQVGRPVAPDGRRRAQGQGARCGPAGAHQGVPDQAAVGLHRKSLARRSRSSATRPMFRSRSAPSSARSTRQVMQRRGANVMVEAGATLASGANLDVTNDVLAALNQQLPSVATTAPAAPAQQQPQGR